jgi:putative endonuclease
MTAERLRLGAEGERAAERCVRRHGYAIVARNYRCPLGEVDLIALDGRTVVFIEVKTRNVETVDTAFDAVDPRKQRQIVRVAEHYLSANRLHDRDVRFDIVGVWRNGADLICELVQDAFEPDDRNGW